MSNRLEPAAGSMRQLATHAHTLAALRAGQSLQDPRHEGTEGLNAVAGRNQGNQSQ